MNLLLLEMDEVVDGVARVEGRRADHLRRVLGVEPGQELRAGLVGGPRVKATVLEVTKKTVHLAIADAIIATTDVVTTDDAPPAPSPAEVDLVVGLPRPQALHRTLQTAAGMGVRRLHLVNAWRVEKSYFQSPSLADDAVRKHLVLGAEQGMTTRLPDVRLERLLVPFVRSLADARADSLYLLAHPDAAWDMDGALDAAGASADTAATLALGPEGGWIDREVETFSEAGFTPVRLGPWILRVEMAVAAALAQLHLARARRG